MSAEDQYDTESFRANLETSARVIEDRLVARREFLYFLIGAGVAIKSNIDEQVSASRAEAASTRAARESAINRSDILTRATKYASPRSIVPELFSGMRSKINVVAGSSNVRNPFTKENRPAPSDATNDLLLAVVASFPWSKTDEVDELDFSLDVPSVTLGGPVASAAWRSILGWEREVVGKDVIRYRNERISKFNGQGFFHDIDREIEFGERASGLRVDWPIRGSGVSLDGITYPGSGVEQALIVTYLADAGNGQSHLNFTGTNGQGTWAGLRLFDPIYVDSAEGAIVARKLDELRRDCKNWQMLFRCSDDYDCVPNMANRKIPKSVQLVATANLDGIGFI